MKKPHILKTAAILTISLLLAPAIVRAEANDTGIAIPPKPAASDGQKRVTLRLASGASLAHAVCHMTDKSLVYTAYDPEPNADGSIDLMMYPCSFVYIESEGTRK